MSTPELPELSLEGDLTPERIRDALMSFERRFRAQAQENAANRRRWERCMAYWRSNATVGVITAVVAALTLLCVIVNGMVDNFLAML